MGTTSSIPDGMTRHDIESTLRGSGNPDLRRQAVMLLEALDAREAAPLMCGVNEASM